MQRDYHGDPSTPSRHSVEPQLPAALPRRRGVRHGGARAACAHHPPALRGVADGTRATVSVLIKCLSLLKYIVWNIPQTHCVDYLALHTVSSI